MKHLIWWVLILGQLSVWSFGRNKVQFQRSHWKLIQSTHFDVYFTLDSKELAEHSANELELMYQDLSQLVDHRLSSRIPVIIHRSHQHFVETNVIRMALPEAVGGFTEVFKKRIVLPFNGSWNEFDHVLKHELLHALMFDQFSGQGVGISMAQRMGGIPLWFKEGLAEYSSLGWNKESEFYLIDAVSTGYLYSPKYNFGGFLAYKGGQSFIYYLINQFGEDVIAKMLKDLVKGYNFEIAFKRATQVSLEEVGELWMRELRRIYWPELGQRKYPKSFAKQLTDHTKDPSNFNLAPSISPNGKRLIYFSDKEDWEGLQLMEIEGRKDLGRILKSGAKGEHESLHPFNSGFSWSSDNQTIAFVSKQKGHDVIHLMNVDTKKIVQIIDPELDMILNPSFNPANPNEIVFSGAKNTQQDLYVYNLKSQLLTQLTNDRATQNSPKFSPDGIQIVFESNASQGKQTAQDNNGLYLYNRATQSLSLLVSQDVKSPTWMGTNTDIAYVSDASGVSNVYHFDLTKGKSSALTNTLSATYTPSVTSDGQQMVFALFERGGWDIYMMESPLDQSIELPLPQTHFLKTSWKNYFHPIQIQNLSSYNKDSLTTDSLKRARDTLAVDSTQAESTQGDSTQNYFEDDNFTQFGSVRARQYDAPIADSSAFSQGPRIDSKGDFIVTDYEPEWSVDQVQAVAGAATNGSNVNFGGQAFVTFTDLMGDQEISMMLFSAGGDLQDVNYALQYQYLPYQWDIGVSTTRFVNYAIDSSQTLLPQGTMTYGEPYSDSVVVDTIPLLYFQNDNPEDTLTLNTPLCLYYTGSRIDTLRVLDESNQQQSCSRLERFRDINQGIQLQLNYPFNVFSRFGLQFSANQIARQRMRFEGGRLVRDGQANIRHLTQFIPGVNYSFDNVRWGFTGPINGIRALASLDYFPEMSANPTSYLVAQADVRNYWRFFKRYTFAWRLSAGSAFGTSQEEIPYRFLVGGDEFNLNFRLNRNNLTGRMIDNYQSSLDAQLRGFDYLDFVGRHKFVSNMDWRFPFIERLDFGWPVRIPFRDIQGILMADYGGAWSNNNAFDQFGLGLGYGWRMNIGYFVLRYTKAWAIKGVGPIERGPRTYWSLGADF